MLEEGKGCIDQNQAVQKRIRVCESCVCSLRDSVGMGARAGRGIISGLISQLFQKACFQLFVLTFQLSS